MSDQGEMLHAIDNKLYREVEGDLEVVGIDIRSSMSFIPDPRRTEYERQLDKMPEEHHSAAINAFLSYEQQIEMKEREREEKQERIEAAREKLVAHLKQSSENGRARK